jgi:hypothetical protein
MGVKLIKPTIQKQFAEIRILRWVELPNWNNGIVEYWNNGKRKSKNSEPEKEILGK